MIAGPTARDTAYGTPPPASVASELALTGAGLSGAALGVMVTLRAAGPGMPKPRLIVWSIALFGGVGAATGWISGRDALLMFLLCAAAAAIVQDRVLTQIAAKSGF